MNPRLLDHLVYAVPNLAAATDRFEQLTGLRPAYGGAHARHGTHNALVHLGGAAYLELIAADPDNTTFTPPRWMGVDEVNTGKMVRWSLKSDDLAADAALLQSIAPALGSVSSGERTLAGGETLRWQMSLPRPAPAVELLPFFLDWSASAFHPTDQLPRGCRIIELTLQHPDPQTLNEQFETLGISHSVVAGPETAISVRLATPKGELVLR